MNFKILTTIFIVFGIIIGILEILNFKLKKTYLIVTGSFLLLCAFRSLKIPDTKEYLYAFEKMNTKIFDFQYFYFEKGFLIFSKLIKILFENSFEIYFFIISFINLFFIKKFIKFNCKFYIIPIILYISFWGIYFNMIILRFGIGFSFYVLSIYFFENKFKKKGIILYILAILFHKSFIFGIISFFIKNKKYNKKKYILFIFLIGILYYSRIGSDLSVIVLEKITMIMSKTSMRYEAYSKNLKFQEGFSFRFLINYLILFVGIVIIKVKNRMFYKYLNIYIFGMFIQAFFSNILLIERITDIFNGINFIVFSMIIEEVKNRQMKFIFFISLVITNFIFISRIIFRNL